ncbi:MAG: hypothetical protein IJ615_09230 [Bacteroidaceae bacterium]|nr:hypothetical protein [Bacteroidaceae bacterium]
MIKHYIMNLSAALALLTPVSLMALEKDGETWLIGSADELIEFAQKVNSGEASSNGYGDVYARLTADIDLRGRETDFPMIGTAGLPYKGDFDGQLHSITFNLETASDNSGLFAYLNSGTVKNLCVNGSMTVNHNSCGAIVGNASGFASIQNCTSNVDITIEAGVCIGGIVGYSQGIWTPPYVRIENCIYTGHLMGHTACSAGIAGWCDKGGGGYQTIIKNCLVTGEFDVEIGNDYNHIIARGETPDANVTNCYYVHPTGIGVQEGQEVTQVTMEQVQSGEACYLLNVSHYKWGGTARSTVFRQNIGEDKVPVFDPLHGVVAKIGPEGYATWAGGDFNIWMEADAAHVAEGVKAYAGTVKGHSLLLHPVVVMNGSNGGYVIKGEPGYYSFMPTNEEPTDVENDLKGASDVIDPRWGTYYVLAVMDDVLGFYRVANNGNGIDSHTANLANPSFDADVKMLSLIFDDETGIEAVNGAEPEVHGGIYDLSGRSIEKMRKGVYIINGKKILR